MKHQEKKYRVVDFAAIQQKLAKLSIEKQGQSSSTHYYAPQPNNNVVKLVEHADRCEVHMLEETNGKFTQTQKIPLMNLKEGFDWLRNHGYSKVAVVRMSHADYAYQDGIIGLYIINDFLHSVILDFPGGEHDEVAKALGLEDHDVIEVPYNKYLEQMGRSEEINV